MTVGKLSGEATMPFSFLSPILIGVRFLPLKVYSSLERLNLLEKKQEDTKVNLFLFVQVEEHWDVPTDLVLLTVCCNLFELCLYDLLKFSTHIAY